ncbi:Bax inhibitor-1/YccA family protein [Pseudolysinimonas sp.]|uniref:Bax inhibitor-1/YccA family protein n=1 Tax=Pseudolysinimonas sp. TaxID=2680009 RepID=UPI003F7F7868
MANFAFSNSPAFDERAAKRAAAKDAAAGVPPVPVPTAEQLQAQYDLPTVTADQAGRMTYEDTIVKTLVSFGILLAGAAIGWFVPILAIPAALIGFVLALVNTFKRKPSPALVLLYAGVEGVFVGGISSWFSQMWQGIIPIAVLGTLGVVGVTLALFASGKVRASSRATKVFLVLMVGYLVFSLVNVVLMLTGVVDNYGGLRGVEIFGIPLGIPLGILVVLMAAYSLVIDFDQVKRGVETGQPRIYGWTAAFGIMVTVVWLYLEILRLLSYFMPRN